MPPNLPLPFGSYRLGGSRGPLWHHAALVAVPPQALAGLPAQELSQVMAWRHPGLPTTFLYRDKSLRYEKIAGKTGSRVGRKIRQM
jgi:hypothetical protein